LGRIGFTEQLERVRLRQAESPNSEECFKKRGAHDLAGRWPRPR
jgi:hypothetical protein